MVVVIAGLIVTVCTALVIIGGIKRIANVSEVFVPFMAVLYVVFAVLLLLCNVTKFLMRLCKLFKVRLDTVTAYRESERLPEVYLVQ